MSDEPRPGHLEPPPVTAFELTGALPRGVTVLEASAGTGKTFTIAALAARFIAAGTPLHELLLVTFTRMATGELRERVRERLVATELELGRLLAGAAPDGLDDVTAAMAEGEPEAVKLRRDRLAAAISNFDAATIATTHSFCQEVLAELGTLGDLEPDVSFSHDIEDLVDEVIDDLYVRAFLNDSDPPFDRAEAGRIARMAIEHPTAAIHPLHPQPGGVPARRSRLAAAARAELESRKRALAVMTYDDLLVRLRDTLLGVHGDAAVARLRSRYSVVLIDEFQDTDPVQWEIVSRAFDAASIALVLVADPKQAIYAFRGADVHAYLAAARSAAARATLQTNRRSDQTLIDALDALFAGARLGHPEIAYRTVRATDAHQRPRLRGAPCDAALRIRVVDRMQPSVTVTTAGYASTPSTREHVAKDLAADVVSLLDSGAGIERRDRYGVTVATEAVRPRDVAVLVQSHRNARLVHGELSMAGIPAVVNGAGSVLATAAARDWLSLLSALERPASPPRARAAALTPFLGWDAVRIACAGEEQLEELHRRLHAWARLLRARGVAALAEAITHGEALPARLLRERGGERRLTDLEHVAQVLHAASSAEQLGTAALASWLRQRIAGPAREGERDELTRRLESDAEAVQVLTIHRSKGLEFPIVYCPFLWEPGWVPDDRRPVFFHDADAGARAIDVGLQGAEYEAHRRESIDDDRGEDLRLAYVALTRARHQSVIWWAGSYQSCFSPLSRIAFDRDPDGNIPSRGHKAPSDQTASERFSEIGSRAPGTISVEWSRLSTPTSWSEPPRDAALLAAARFDRRLDSRWRRTSYTDITARAHDAWVSSEPETPIATDEPLHERAALVVADADADADADEHLGLRDLALPLSSMPAGARIGSFIHRVLQSTEFDTGDLAGELSASVEAARGPGTVELGDTDLIVDGLARALSTPLLADPASVALRRVARTDRLDELAFELPLAGGDDARGVVTLAAIAALLREWLAPDDPLRAYAARLEDPLLRASLRGYLTGSIDLVIRISDGGRPAYAIVDYKTNRLAAPDEALSAWHYRPAALTAEMQRSHYALQALLYLAALHRYLRWRAPGYDPERDLAGVHYLFLRGMLGTRHRWRQANASACSHGARRGR